MIQHFPFQFKTLISFTSAITVINYTNSFLIAGLHPFPDRGRVVEHYSPGMQEVCGSIPGHIKQKMLKFEVLLLCLALST